MSSISRILRTTVRNVLPPALLTLFCAPAFAFDYQIHGFAAQGYSLSEGNKVDGDSTGHGSTDYYELGLNGTISITPNLLASAQGLFRRAGGSDTEGLRLDFAQLDYRFLSTERYNLGIRLGRVKNPFGFYNDTRDVVFTRPGIQMPNSVYFESTGLRSVFFSRDGEQVYGGLQLGNHYISVESNYAIDSRLSEKEQENLLGQNLPVRVGIRQFHAERLQDEWNGGMLKFALSHLHAQLKLQSPSDVPLHGDANFNIWVASARYNARRFAVTGEYQISFDKYNSNLTGTYSTASDGFYLQGDYHITPRWNAMLRYSATFNNRHDRDGRDFAAQTGGDRYSAFSHDETVGINWNVNQHWGVWAEFHLLQGTADVPGEDNLGRTRTDHWNLLQLMAAYRF